MTRTSTLIAGIGTMLLLVPAAWGKGQLASPPPDAFERAATASLVGENVVPTPDAFERAAAVGDTSGRDLVFDNHRASEPRSGGRELVFDNYRSENIVLSPDAFERAAAVGDTSGRNLVFDNYRASERRGEDRELVFDNYRVEPTPSSGSSSAQGSEASGGSEMQIEWAQVGLGLALGIVLMMGLYIGLRGTRQRQLAH